MLFTSPLMLLGLGTLPLLAAVYWLRGRSRRAVVSNLAFWVDHRAPRHGGRILHRLQTPLTFFLELLAIAGLVTAAAGPALRQRDTLRPLVVVLDDSYSMLAHVREGSTSARSQAEAALATELRQNDYLVRFILAGVEPRLLGEPLRGPAHSTQALRLWTCQAPGADLVAALALAAEVGGPTARILVLTDHDPKLDLSHGQTQWWACGEKRDNWAFTTATRNRSGDQERVLLEVTHFGTSPSKSRLTLEGGHLAAPRIRLLELEAGSTRQVFVSLPAGAPALRATLDGDALEIDNEVLLLPESAKPVRVRVDVSGADLRRAVVRALEATGQAVVAGERPELIICDKYGALEGDAWRMEILGATDTAAYAGPFVIDRNRDLAKGLSLASVVWSASPGAGLSGLPIVMAGDVPLLSEREEIGGRRRLQMSFVGEASNLQDTPDWPILFDNLVQWRRNGLPGVSAANVRLGQTVKVVLPQEAQQIEVLLPAKTARKLTVRGREVAVLADQVGRHTVRALQAEHAFSCNAVCGDESDLTHCGSGRWGHWNRSAAHQDRQASLRWLFLLAALGLMAAQMAVVARESGEPNR